MAETQDRLAAEVPASAFPETLQEHQQERFGDMGQRVRARTATPGVDKGEENQTGGVARLRMSFDAAAAVAAVAAVLAVRTHAEQLSRMGELT